jgi:hypothetical protein
MVQAMVPARLSEGVRCVGRPVIAHHAADADATLAIPGDGAVEKAHRALPSLVGKELDVSEATRVVDADVGEFPAGAFARLMHARLATGDAMSDAAKPTELLDVDVNQISRIRPLISVGWLRWL